MSTCPSIEPICLLLLLYLHIISPILQNVHLSILFVCPPVPPYGLYIDPSFHIFHLVLHHQSNYQEHYQGCPG